jgi:hypothetical protein
VVGPSRPSFPSDPGLRRLGVGGGGGGERPLRAQLVIALVVGIVLLAVPLYLWRRPSGSENATKDGGLNGDARGGIIDSTNALALLPEAGVNNERVKLGLPQRVKCGASQRGSQEGNLCDRLAFFEDGLGKAIRDNTDCVPKNAKEGTINYVLTVDFTAKKIHMFPGASGSWKGPAARKAAQCVKKALPAPDWNTVQHQYRYYSIAVLATYAAPASSAPTPAPPAASGTSAAPAGSGAPLFE